MTYRDYRRCKTIDALCEVKEWLDFGSQKYHVYEAFRKKRISWKDFYNGVEVLADELRKDVQ